MKENNKVITLREVAPNVFQVPEAVTDTPPSVSGKVLRLSLVPVEFLGLVAYETIKFAGRGLMGCFGLSQSKKGSSYCPSQSSDKDLRFNPYGGTGYVAKNEGQKTNNITINVNVNQ